MSPLQWFALIVVSQIPSLIMWSMKRTEIKFLKSRNKYWHAMYETTLEEFRLYKVPK